MPRNRDSSRGHKDDSSRAQAPLHDVPPLAERRRVRPRGARAAPGRVEHEAVHDFARVGREDHVLERFARSVHARVAVAELHRGEDARPAGPGVGRELGARVAQHDVRRAAGPAAAAAQRAGALVAVVVPVPGHIHAVLEKERLQRRAQLAGQELVAVGAGGGEGAVDVHGPVPAHDDPGCRGAVDRREVALDEGVLLAPGLKQVLWERRGKGRYMGWAEAG